MNQPDASGFRLTPRLIVGLMIVAFGIALLLDELNLMEAGELIHYWPFGLVAIGIAKILQDKERSSRISGGIFLGIGLLLVLDNFVRIDFDVWRLWPLVIVFFGGLILWRSLRPAPAGTEGPGFAIGGVSTSPKMKGHEGPRGGSLETNLSEFAMWSGVQRRVASPNFKRADLTAIMGGIEFDLRQAGTDNGEAVIEVFAMWGGIEITVPPDWAVSNQVTPIMGGAEDSSTGTQQSRNRLIVKGVVIMGGVDIKV